jgi:hypothetical protein
MSTEREKRFQVTLPVGITKTHFGFMRMWRHKVRYRDLTRQTVTQLALRLTPTEAWTVFCCCVLDDTVNFLC